MIVKTEWHLGQLRVERGRKENQEYLDILIPFAGYFEYVSCGTFSTGFLNVPVCSELSWTMYFVAWMGNHG